MNDAKVASDLAGDLAAQLPELRGKLKAGAVLADQDTSLMVEAASGKRTKVKAGSVLLRFASPGASDVLGEAHRLASELDPTFLWEASDDGEFSFADLAREYYGAGPTPAHCRDVCHSRSRPSDGARHHQRHRTG